ncbi:hypothetical protein LL038_24940 (plasmid) [Clostridium estertheticum]|uniref:Uncharacterized protein n=1 Tax=Clostridium estertheticum TaxID=238834 RepID=A0AA47EPS1_9CLOT|nr:hypothetical protein [Clostridium estertheticum]MBU3158051.1 hypothetical protein [Clostridium estertheticum]WAG63274.1 hypothetical protein LL038_24940 [Clostridium estertheticum]
MKKLEDCTPYELTEITTELVAFLSKNMDANSLNLVCFGMAIFRRLSN